MSSSHCYNSMCHSLTKACFYLENVNKSHFGFSMSVSSGDALPWEVHTAGRGRHSITVEKIPKTRRGLHL